MNKLTYKLHLEPEAEGGYTVTVPALPACVTWGDSLGHALLMAQEAIGAYLEVLQEEGRDIPQDSLNSNIDTIIQIECSPAA